MKNIKEISKENKTIVIKRILHVFFIVSMLLFIIVGLEYRNVLLGAEELSEFASHLSHEDPSSLNGLYVKTTITDVDEYYLVFKYRWNESYYYTYRDNNSNLIISIAVDENRKNEMDELVKSKGSLEIEGTTSFISDQAYEIGKHTIEGLDGELLQDNFWDEVSPYVINVDRLSLVSVSTGKKVFYSTITIAISSLIIEIYFNTKLWKRNKVFFKLANIKNGDEKAYKDIVEVEVISNKQNRVLVGKDYVFYKENFYINTYKSSYIKDLRWIKIRRIFAGKTDYVFSAVDKDGEESIIAVCRGKKEMGELVDRIVRKNDKIILGSIKEVEDKKLNLKNNKEELMSIVNRIYKKNTYSHMKEKK